MSALTQKRLKELLSYDPENGRFTRLVLRGRPAAHERAAGYTASKGYQMIGVDGRRYMAHRLAWLYTTGEWPLNYIDHINGRKGDNRIANLREATNAENHQNVWAPRVDSLSSGLRGVCFYKRDQSWQAQIVVRGKQKYLGRYTTKEQAHQAYLAAKYELHPFSRAAML